MGGSVFIKILDGWGCGRKPLCGFKHCGEVSAMKSVFFQQENQGNPSYPQTNPTNNKGLIRGY